MVIMIVINKYFFRIVFAYEILNLKFDNYGSLFIGIYYDWVFVCSYKHVIMVIY